MKTARLFAAAAAVAVIAAGTAAQLRASAGPGGDERAVLMAECGWERAYLAADGAALARIEAEDVSIVDPDGSFSTRAEEVSDLTSGKLHFTRMNSGEMRVRMYGGAAVVTGRTRADGSYDGKPFSGSYAFTDVWTERDGRWQLVATQVTMEHPGGPAREVADQCATLARA